MNLQKYYQLKKNYKRAIKSHIKERHEFVSNNIIPKSKCIMTHGNVVKDFRKPFEYAIKFLNEGKDLNLIRAYLVPSDIMDLRKEYAICDGFYNPGMRIICVRDGEGNQDNEFCKEISKYVKPIGLDDVFVHELLHAVSHENGRSTRKFSKIEEEFVYKSTVDWFIQKGYQHDKIIDDYLLPFIIYDIISGDLDKIIYQFSKENKTRDEIIKENMTEIINQIVEKAREVGFSMIGQNNKIENDFSVGLDFS